MSDPRIGARIGGYEIDSLLGRGGMGVVYRARHLRLGRMVALKVLAPELAADENFRTRFMRESQMAASIDHPNVIPVYDADEIDGVLLLAMRYVDGTDLKKVIERDGALEPDKALSVISQIAGALDAAHAKGLIHRDVKPANVLVEVSDTGSEHVYLTDFGLTKHSSSHSGLTATGAFVGTIDYISPEQIEGKSVDARTDIYALGCVLYECLTGQVPFKKDADVAVMYAHLMDPRPKVTDANASLPVAVDAVLDKAMAREPDDRYATSAALVADLRVALRPMQTPVEARADAQDLQLSVQRPVVEAPVVESPHVRTARRLTRRMLTIGLASLVVVAAAAYLVTRDGAKSTATGGGATPGGDSTPVGSIPTDAIFVSPDGSKGASGTEDQPVATLAEAVDMAGEGGSVILVDGTYEASQKPMLVIDQAVTISGATGATPILKGSDANSDGIFIEAGTSGVRISNLKFDGFLGEALKVFCEDCGNAIENRDITLKELEFTGGWSPIIVENVSGLTLQGISVHENEFTGLLCSPGPCDHVTIVDSFFHSASDRFGEGVRIEKGDDVSIETSDLSSNPGNGLFSNATSTRVTRSRFQDNGGVGAILTGSDSEIRDSLVARNGEEGLILGEGGCKGCEAKGVFGIANVLIADNGLGISFENDDSGEITLQLFNSIVTGNNGTGLRILGAVHVARLDNNLFDTGKWLAIVYRGEGYTDDDLNNSRFPGNVDAATYASAPQFVAPDDYHLTPDSSGVDQGTQEGVVSQVDIDGNPRVAGDEIDMGPFERE